MTISVLAVDDSRTMRDMISLALKDDDFDIHLAEDGEHGLDVLDGIGELKICTDYRLDGTEISYLPPGIAAQARVEATYETLEGWDDSTQGARSWADLPATAVKYIRRVEELIGSPVA